MRSIHVECYPDEALVKQLGFKQVKHHSGKSRVFGQLSKEKKQCAMVDEDPGSAKSNYEKGLRLLNEKDGLKQFTDNNGNIVVVLQGKLEDWILVVCKKSGVDISRYNLPINNRELHSIIHLRLKSFNDLIQDLLKRKNPALLTLKSFLEN
jgi:hypothetical protein